MDEQGFERLVARTYDAALEETAWHGLVDGIRHETGSIAAGILRHTRRSQESTASFLHGIAPSSANDYRAYFRRRIPWVNLPAFYHPGVVRTDRTIDRHYNRCDAFKSTEYFNDWMAPQGFRHIMRTVLRRDDDGYVSFFLFRESARGAFTGHDETMFQHLVPHLTRAAEIRRRFGQLESESALTMRTMDQLSSGVISLDKHGRIQGLNAFAEEILLRGDGLMAVRRKIRPSQAACRAKFAAAVERALQSGSTPKRAAQTISVSRPMGRIPLAVTVVPVTTQTTRFHEPRSSVVLLVADPESRLPLRVDILMDIFGLTHAEAGLAALLARGDGLRDAAISAGIRYQTARSYLKIIFQKTRTQRQSELVRLLLATGI